MISGDEVVSLWMGAQIFGKKTVVYAPTFRRGKTVDVQSLMDTLGTGRYNIVVKLHPLYRGDSAAADSGANVIYDDDFTSFDWLAAADMSGRTPRRCSDARRSMPTRTADRG